MDRSDRSYSECVPLVAAIVTALTLSSGLQGVVTRSPTTPVCRTDEPCSAPAPGVQLVFVRGDRQYTVRTDARGRYRIALPPGVYTVRLRQRPALGRGLEPAKAVVPRGRFATKNFSLDTGIR